MAQPHSILLIIAISILALQSGIPIASAQCTSYKGPYFMEADSGGWYSLVGVCPDLSITNHTRIDLTGTFIPTNPQAFVNPDPNYRGTVYVNQYSINGATYTYGLTVVQVNGSVTVTSTITQNGPSLGMVINDPYGGSFTATTLTLAGWLDYGAGSCVTPLGSNQSSTQLGASAALGNPVNLPQENSNPANIFEYVIIGTVLAAILIVTVLLLRRGRQTPTVHSRAS